jgi:hypothetical protein
MAILLSVLNVTKQHYGMMEGLFREGQSANKVQNIMKGFGIGYRRSTIQAVRRSVLDVLKYEGRVDRLTESQIPNKSQILETTWKEPYKYKIYGTVDMVNSVTGETKTMEYSGYLENLRSKEEMTRDAYDKLTGSEYENITSFANFHLKQIFHQKGASW